MAEPDNDVDDIPTNGASNTFNDLDERFQLKPDMDPEFIFDEEKKMIAQLREQFADLKYYSDKMLCWFLCARRHIMDDVVKLVDKFLAKRKEYNWLETIPNFSSGTMQEFFKEKVSMHPHKAVDKHGRLVYYFFLGRNSPRSLETMITYYMWECHYLVETESLANLRNGNLWVFDMDGFSLWKNVDMSSQGRSWASVMTGTFPFRIRGIIVLNAGFFTRALLGTAKLVLPAKLLKRISISNLNDLKALVDEQHLPTVYGGKNPCDFDKQLEFMNKTDKKIVEDWKQQLESIVKISPAPSPFPSRSATPAPDSERIDDVVSGTNKLSLSSSSSGRSKTPPPPSSSESDHSKMTLALPAEKSEKRKSPKSSPRDSKSDN